MRSVDQEPCGCAYGSADLPFKRDFSNLLDPDREYEFDERLRAHTECIECGAVWSTKEDDQWVNVMVLA